MQKKLPILLVVFCFLFAVRLWIPRSVVGSELAVNLNPMTQITAQLPSPPGMVWGFVETYMQTNGTIGWSFTLSRPMTITGLAWSDQDIDGLVNAHEVGIWNIQNGGGTNAQLVASATVPAGTNTGLVGEVWRSVDLGSATTLTPGTYNIAGTYYTQNPDIVKYAFGPPSDPRIVLGSPVFSSSSLGNRPPNPLFQCPDDEIVVAGGIDLGPNLLVMPEVPTLQIGVSNRQVVLSWPSWATNYVAEENQIGRA